MTQFCLLQNTSQIRIHFGSCQLWNYRSVDFNSDTDATFEQTFIFFLRISDLKIGFECILDNFRSFLMKKVCLYRMWLSERVRLTNNDFRYRSNTFSSSMFSEIALNCPKYSQNLFLAKKTISSECRRCSDLSHIHAVLIRVFNII